MNKKNLSKAGYLMYSTTNLAGGGMKNLDLSRAGSASSPRLCALSVSLILALAACTPGSNLAQLPPASDPDYHLGPGDQVRVITYDEPQLTNTFTVDADGTVSIPLVGAIRASGLTSSQLASAITSSLSGSKLISQPSVSVEIAAYRPISVLGEVNRPGQYPYEPGMTTLDAVALAGGFTYRAVTGYAGDLRSDGNTPGHAVQGRVDPGATLEPGDVITIYERYF
jgi:polysaccharide biosynthesis/export protein